MAKCQGTCCFQSKGARRTAHHHAAHSQTVGLDTAPPCRKKLAFIKVSAGSIVSKAHLTPSGHSRRLWRDILPELHPPWAPFAPARRPLVDCSSRRGLRRRKNAASAHQRSCWWVRSSANKLAKECGALNDCEGDSTKAVCSEMHRPFF